MRFKYISAVGLVALTVLGLTACDSTAKSAAPGTSGSASASIPAPASVATACRPNLRVGLVTINLQALFFNQINTGAQTIATKSGVDLQVVSANDDPLAQITAVEQFITQGVDAIIILPIDTVGIKPAIDTAADAKIPVVVVDGQVDSNAITSMVGTANEASSKKLAEYLATSTKTRGEIGVVAALNSTIQLLRQKGFVDQAIKDGFSQGTIVDGKNVQETAQTASENLLTANPKMRFAFATGEPALIGLAAAVETQDAGSRVNVVGWDLSDAAVGGLKAGWLKAIVQQNTFEFGYQGMNSAIKAACGDPVEAFVPIATQIVTPANYTDFLYYLEK